MNHETSGWDNPLAHILPRQNGTPEQFEALKKSLERNKMTREQEIQQRLSFLKLEQDNHSAELSKLAQEKRELTAELYCLSTGLNIGDQVKFMEGGKLKTGEITAFASRWDDESLPIVTIHKADGSLGVRTTSPWAGYKFEGI